MASDSKVLFLCECGHSSFWHLRTGNCNKIIDWEDLANCTCTEFRHRVTPELHRTLDEKSAREYAISIMQDLGYSAQRVSQQATLVGKCLRVAEGDRGPKNE